MKQHNRSFTTVNGRSWPWWVLLAGFVVVVWFHAFPAPVKLVNCDWMATEGVGSEIKEICQRPWP